MPQRKGSALSYQEQLRIIEQWTVRFVQCHLGGTITPPNHPHGDLRHEDGTYSEVKSAGLSAGAIIRRKQLRQHMVGPTRNYVLVFRQNRIRKDGQWHYTTLRHRTQETLERHLLETVTEVCIVDKTGIDLLYRKLRRKKKEQTYHFQSGLKSYVKMGPGDFGALVLRGFQRSSRLTFVRFEGMKVRVSETKIPAKTV